MEDWNQIVNSVAPWKNGKILQAQGLAEHEAQTLALARYYSLALGETNRLGVLEKGEIELVDIRDDAVRLIINKNIVVLDKNKEILITKASESELSLKVPGTTDNSGEYYLCITKEKQQQEENNYQQTFTYLGKFDIKKPEEAIKNSNIAIAKIDIKKIKLNKDFIPEMINLSHCYLFLDLARSIEKNYHKFIEKNPELSRISITFEYPLFFEKNILNFSTKEWLILQWKRIKISNNNKTNFIDEYCKNHIINYFNLINTIDHFWKNKLMEYDSRTIFINKKNDQYRINNKKAEVFIPKIIEKRDHHYVFFNEPNSLVTLYACSNKKIGIRVKNKSKESYWNWGSNSKILNFSNYDKIEKNIILSCFIFNISDVSEWIVLSKNVKHIKYYTISNKTY